MSPGQRQTGFAGMRTIPENKEIRLCKPGLLRILDDRGDKTPIELFVVGAANLDRMLRLLV
jgi:hypothetical protein